MAGASPEKRMLIVSILTVKRRTINSHGLVNPLLANKNRLRDVGISIGHVYDNDLDVLESDVLLIDSKFYREYWSNRASEALAAIERLRNLTNKLYWFDSGDSTGMVQSQVLPIVDCYLKAQTLFDKSLYMQPQYGGRLYTNYFNKYASVCDSNPQSGMVVTPTEQSKIVTGWNYGMVTGYGRANRFMKYLPSGIENTFSRVMKNRYNNVDSNNELDLFVRMNLSYARETISYQRVRTIELLKKFYVESERISKSKYLAEMSKSKIVVSPFGWGEINIRDFECFVSGSMLMKPDMSHLSTYPQFYKENVTYLPINWNLANLVSSIEYILENPKQLREIAAEGQQRFRYFTEQEEGRNEFAEYVRNRLTKI